MSIVTRRNFMKTAAAGLSLPALGRGAFRRRAAQGRLTSSSARSATMAGPGRTNKGRLAMDDALKGQVVSSYVENVKEDASAIPILKDLAQKGNKLIFTTSYGYMDQTIEVAKQFPDVKFEHCTGYKRADNVGTYNSRFHQGGRSKARSPACCRKRNDRLSRLLQGAGSCARREFVHARGTGGQPEHHHKAGDDRFTWFDPAKEAAAAETLASTLAATSSPSTSTVRPTLQVCEQRKVFGVSAMAPICPALRPMTQLDAQASTSGARIISHAQKRCSIGNLEVG